MALRGDRFDGHDYVAAVAAQGAVAAAGYLPLPDRFRNRLLDAIQAIRA